MLVSDYFTQWMEKFAIPNQEAVTVAETLVEEVFCDFLSGTATFYRQFEGKRMQ